MSTISSLDKALGFYPEPKSRAPLRRFLSVVQTYWSAVHGGLAAARAYHELTMQGATHEAAVAKVFEHHLSVR